MKEKITILSVGVPYDFDSDAGTKISGCTMWYIATDKLSPTENDGVLGYVPLKESMPIEFYERAKAQSMPSIAEVTYAMRNSNGKQVLKIIGLDFPSK